MRMWRIYGTLLCAAVACAGCKKRPLESQADSPPAQALAPQAKPPTLRLLPVEGTVANGLSGLAKGEGDSLWAVSERSHRLHHLVPKDRGFHVKKSWVLAQVARGHDTESLTFLSPSQFAVGTEALEKGRAKDLIYVFDMTPKGPKLARTIDVPYALWDLSAMRNRGVEGLTFCKPWLVAGIETVLRKEGKRYAPVVFFKQPDGKPVPMRLALTTDTGKLSSVSCRANEDGTLHLWVLERHYGVARVLETTVNLARVKDGVLVPRVALDLSASLKPLPNFEGIAPWGHELILLVDNQSATIAGKSRMYALEAP